MADYAFHAAPPHTAPLNHAQRRERIEAALACRHCHRGTVVVSTFDGSFGTLEPGPCPMCDGTGYRVSSAQEAAEVLIAAELIPPDAFPAPHRRFYPALSDPGGATEGAEFPPDVASVELLAIGWRTVLAVEHLACEVYARLLRAPPGMTSASGGTRAVTVEANGRAPTPRRTLASSRWGAQWSTCPRTACVSCGRGKA